MQTTHTTHRFRPEAASTAATSYGLGLVDAWGAIRSKQALAERLMR